MKTIKNIYLMLVTLSLISVLFIPQLSLSGTELIKSPLTDFSAGIYVNSKDLETIKLRVMKVNKRNNPAVEEKLLDGIEAVYKILDNVQTMLNYESKLILTMPHIKDEYKTFFCESRIKELKKAKHTLELYSPELNYFYRDAESYKSILLPLGDPRKIIQSSLELIDKSIKKLKC